jgi:manganese/zinc/iron transport system permease protein
MTGLVALALDHTVQTVVLGAAILGVVSGVLGSFAVLRRQSLLGDALSHAALPGICLGFLVAGARDLGSVMAGAFFTGALAALAVLVIERRTRLKTDAALGIVLSVFFAVGVVLLTLVQGRGGAGQAGLSTFLFGQAAAMLRADLWVMGGVTAAALAVVAGFWKEFKLVTFDADYARTLGLPVLALEVALTVMVAVAIVVGLQIVGVVLMTAMLVAPAAAARQWAGRLEAMVGLAAVFGAAAGVTGALISALGPGLATGPLVVLAASGIVVVSLVAAPERGLVWRWIEDVRARRRLEGQAVLMSLRALSDSHEDPRYPAEAGMIDTYHGRPTGRALARLEAGGLVRAVRHEPERTPHWQLTGAGHAAAERAREEEAR